MISAVEGIREANMTLMRNRESGAPLVKKLRDGLSRMLILLRPVSLKLEERHPGSSPSRALISSSVLLKVWKEPIPSPGKESE